MKYDVKLNHRLSRVVGQIKGIQKMMDEEKDCREVVTQLAAARNALDRTMALIVSENLAECIRQERKDDERSEELIQEAVNLLIKSR